MDNSRFQKIQSLNDLKREKLRIKNEVLEAENRIEGNIEAIQSMTTIANIISSASYSFDMAQNIYIRIRDFIARLRGSSKDNDGQSKRKRKKKNKTEN